MDSIVKFLEGRMTVILIIIILLFIFLYVMYAVFLNKLNKAIYGKTTIMAWLPIFNTYLLGKVAINKLFGWILIILAIVSSKVTMTTNGIEKVYSILPSNLCEAASIIYLAILIITYIYAHFKLKRIQRTGTEKNEYDQFSKGNLTNLNRPFVDSNNAVSKYVQMNNEEDMEAKKNNRIVYSNPNDPSNFYNTMETPKISLSSLNHHDAQNNANNNQPKFLNPQNIDNQDNNQNSQNP